MTETNIETTIERIREKLVELSAHDRHFSIFGASQHRYELRRRLRESEIRQVETRYAISLPAEYRAFLLHLGNGGAGPDYGVFSLHESLQTAYENDGAVEERAQRFKLSFPHNKPWNIGSRSDDPPLAGATLQRYEQEYFRDDYLQGTLRFHTEGCNHDTLLVLNGPERGNLWHDERTIDLGLFPFANRAQLPQRLTFFAWYEEWLDRALGLAEPEAPWPAWYRKWLDRSLGLRQSL